MIHVQKNDLNACVVCTRFHGLDGHAAEFQLKPSWTLPLSEAPLDWDVNPATEDVPLEDVLAEAAAVRQGHLEGTWIR